MAETIAKLEGFVGNMMRKHPEIVPLVEKVQKEPWIVVVDRTFKRSDQHGLIMVVNIADNTLHFQFVVD